MVKNRQLSPKPLFDEPSLRNFLSRYDAKPVHMGKIWRHMLAHPECPLDEIPGIPANIRAPLREEFAYLTSTVTQVAESQIDGTIKLLIRLQDGGEIEAVMIHHSGEAEHPEKRQADRCGERDTLCISSQVGCRLGCTFCATATMGLSGNLWSGEIQEQLVHASRIRPISNVVFMGMGEPLENYDGVVQAIRGLVDTGKFGMAPKSVTVSTVGIVGNMRRLMDDCPQVKLAVSLHAPTQELREQIVPIGKTYKMDMLMEVVDEYAARVTSDGKRKGMVMISYVLLNEVNDSVECAGQLRDLVKDKPVIVNLIPYNSFDGNEHNYRTPSPERVDAFLKVLEAGDIRVFERRHHGRDIAAACGQLAKISVEKQPIADIESCSCKLSKDLLRKPQAEVSTSKVGQMKNAMQMTADAMQMTADAMQAHRDTRCWLATGIVVASLGAATFIRWRSCRG
jgi:sorting nexin-8